MLISYGSTDLNLFTIRLDLPLIDVQLLNANIISAQQTPFSATAAPPHKRGEGQRSIIPDNVDNEGRKVPTRSIRARLRHRTAGKIRLI